MMCTLFCGLILIFHLRNQVWMEFRCSWMWRDATVRSSLEDRMALISAKEAMMVEGYRGMSAVSTVYSNAAGNGSDL